MRIEFVNKNADWVIDDVFSVIISKKLNLICVHERTGNRYEYDLDNLPYDDDNSMQIIIEDDDVPMPEM